MRALLFRKENQEVIMVVEKVSEVGPDFIIGENELNGINIDVLDYIVVNSEVNVKIGDSLPEGLVDVKSNLIKPTLDDFGRELAMEKMKNIQSESTIASLGIELSKVKMELIGMKGATL